MQGVTCEKTNKQKIPPSSPKSYFRPPYFLSARSAILKEVGTTAHRLGPAGPSVPWCLVLGETVYRPGLDTRRAGQAVIGRVVPAGDSSPGKGSRATTQSCHSPPPREIMYWGNAPPFGLVFTLNHHHRGRPYTFFFQHFNNIWQNFFFGRRKIINKIVFNSLGKKICWSFPPPQKKQTFYFFFI